MRATARCILLGLLLVLAGRAATADDTVGPRRMGEFLGLVLVCECLPYEQREQELAFYAMLSEGFGQSYADTAAGYMRRTMAGSYRNTALMCAAHVCSNDFALYLDEVMTLTAMEDDSYLGQYEADYGAPDETGPAADPQPSLCAFKPFNPRCRTEP